MNNPPTELNYQLVAYGFNTLIIPTYYYNNYLIMLNWIKKKKTKIQIECNLLLLFFFSSKGV